MVLYRTPSKSPGVLGLSGPVIDVLRKVLHCQDELALTGSSSAEAMLSVMEYFVHIQVSHDAAAYYMFQHLTCD